KRAKALGIEKEQPEAAELQPRRRAYGSVLDPSPLLVLDGELAAAEAALAASKSDSERTQALAATNDASKKAVETSAAQYQADRIKVEGLMRNSRLQWGSVFMGDAKKRRTFTDDLVAGNVALIRIDLLPGDKVTELPAQAKVLIMGREEQPI